MAVAVDLLRSGRLVAFPTETVYGLGADATNPAAVARVFAAKGRPAHNPLIVHVANSVIAKRYVADWPAAASRLSNAFWPGPLTIVLPKHPSITDAATAGGATVGLRVPHHPLAIELLYAFDGPVAAPSANRSNRVSPTTAAHVRDELGDAVDLVLDGGPCAVGIESTVLDLTGERPRVLRPGHITARQIEAALGRTVDDFANAPPDEPGDGPARPLASPGQMPLHYAPRTPAFHFKPHQRDELDLDNAAALVLTIDPEAYARHLYARLRLLDTQELRAIYVELPPDTPQWRAVRDRVLRATQPL
ncbi:MAG TPA: L-threonylcarbamoyladenylate synthase [Tepidisphaeraceae bacterium]